MNRQILVIMAVLSIVVIATMSDTADCTISTNLAGIRIMRARFSPDRYTAQNLDSSGSCSCGVYIGTKSLLEKREIGRAVTFLEENQSRLNRPVSLFPRFFQSALEARQLVREQRWMDAVNTYRRMFWEGSTARQNGSRLGHRWDLREFNDEYQRALVNYHLVNVNGTEKGLTARLHQALWFWRLGNLRDALSTISEVRSSQLSSRVNAYRLLLKGDLERTRGNSATAAYYYAQIPAEERVVFLRGLVTGLQLEQQAGLEQLSTKWEKTLREWQPSIVLEHKLKSADATLLGAEVLEPDLVADGGTVCVLLFLEGQSASGEHLLQLGNGRVIQEFCSRNLIQDPGFEWPRDGTASDWYFPRQIGTLPYWPTSFGGNPTKVVCLTFDSDNARRSGIGQQGVRLEHSETFLLLAEVVSNNSGVGTLQVRWQVDPKKPVYSGVGAIDSIPSWSWIGNAVVSPANAWGAHIYFSNRPTDGTVCIDNLIMLQLDFE